MLTHIHIRDFAIIEDLELELGSGMTVLTGETGAGKSILIDAIGLVLGDRADSATVRHGASRAEVSVELDINGHQEAARWLAEQDLEPDSGCLLRRVVGADGRSRAYVNGSPVKLQALKQLGEMLVDLHGQHEHQSLMRRPVQRELLDNYADHAALLSQVAEHYQHWASLKQQLDDLRAQGDARRERLDLLRYQVQELDALDLKTGELPELEAEHARLANAGRLLELAQGAYQTLYEGDEQTVHDQLSSLCHSLDEAAGLDERLVESRDLLANAQIQVAEAADGLRRYTDHLELDPQRLAWVEDRLGEIQDLARKHRVAPAELPGLHEQLREELAHMEDSHYDLQTLEQELDKSEASYRQAARALSESREQAARQLGEQVSEAMQGLGMAGGCFEVQVEHDPEERFSAHGSDRIDYQVTANPGQPLRPLTKVASGGELSRISLAIQMIAARAVSIPTLIFDEVDTGIGGAVAEAVGRQLSGLGEQRQVLCVTHLPQVAAQAHHHLQVYKRKWQESTETEIASLDPSERVNEVARMLGGLQLTDQTLAHAREMIEQAGRG